MKLCNCAICGSTPIYKREPLKGYGGCFMLSAGCSNLDCPMFTVESNTIYMPQVDAEKDLETKWEKKNKEIKSIILNNYKEYMR